MKIEIQVSLKTTHQSHLSRIALIHYGGINEMNDDMVRKFIQLAPWADWPALSWRSPEDPRAPGVVTVTASLNHETAALMNGTIDQINQINRRTLQAQITPRIFIATSIYWWIHHVYPMPSGQYD